MKIVSGKNGNVLTFSSLLGKNNEKRQIYVCLPILEVQVLKIIVDERNFFPCNILN